MHHISMYSIRGKKIAISATVLLVICLHPNASFRTITMTFTPISGTAKQQLTQLHTSDCKVGHLDGEYQSINIQGVPDKNCTCTTILQPYVTESCSFQQNIQKEILYMTGQCLNTAIIYSLFCSWQVKYLKTKLTEKSKSKSFRQICGENKVLASPIFQN